MGKLNDHINISGFSVKDIDTSELEDIIDWLPTTGVFDLNIAEQGLVKALHAENSCQEIIAKLDRYIGTQESEKSRAWADAALNKAKTAGYKTAKDKEWFAAADEEYITVVNEITLAKAGKKWFEKKADYFRGWHYAFKTFLKRDYSLERLGNALELGYNIDTPGSREHEGDKPDLGGEMEW
jgi:hypothetical protein